MARVAVPPDVAAYISARIAGYASESPEPFRWLAPYVGEFKALPLYLGWWEVTGIRADGEFVCWSTEHEYPGVRPVEERYFWLSSLVDGCRRYPELRALLPNRPTDAVDCRHMAHPLFAEGKVFCPECCGLGWVFPGQAQQIGTANRPCDDGSSDITAPPA